MIGSKKSLKTKLAIILLCLLYLATSASALTIAEAIKNVVCKVLKTVMDPLPTIGVSLVLLMIIYAAVKYVYSADDPGGRKQAKSIIVNALIGGIILLIAVPLGKLAVGSNATFCEGTDSATPTTLPGGPPGNEGDPCSDPNECNGNLLCFNGVCTDCNTHPCA